MSTSFTRRALLALAATFGMVVGIASPASAAIEVGDITAGIVAIGDYEFDIANPDPAPCQIADVDPTISVDFKDPSPAGGTEVTAVTVRRGFFQVPNTPTSPYYAVDLSLYTGAGANNTGTISGGGISQSAALQGAIYSLGTVDPGEPCPTGDLVCTALIQLSMTGSWSGANPVPPGTAVVSGGGTVVAPFPVPCSDFDVHSQIHNAMASITNLTVNFP